MQFSSTQNCVCMTNTRFVSQQSYINIKENFYIIYTVHTTEIYYVFRENREISALIQYRYCDGGRLSEKVGWAEVLIDRSMYDV